MSESLITLFTNLHGISIDLLLVLKIVCQSKIAQISSCKKSDKCIPISDLNKNFTFKGKMVKTNAKERVLGSFRMERNIQFFVPISIVTALPESLTKAEHSKEMYHVYSRYLNSVVRPTCITNRMLFLVCPQLPWYYSRLCKEALRVS